MKTKLYSLLALFLLVPAVVLAGDEKGKITKEKKISKTYLVNADTGLEVKNKYGNVYVTTWDENKTSVEIQIKVSGSSEEVVNKRLNSIDVDLEALRDRVSAITKIGNFSGGKTSMEINYTVKIPRNGSVSINNQYGGIILDKINGESYIVCKYGHLAIDELNSKKNLLDIEYCGSSKIGTMDSGKIIAKYSGLELNKGGVADITSEYSNIHLINVDEVNFKSEYGEINILNSKKVLGYSSYMETKIGTISNMLNLTSNYGNIKIGGLAHTVKNVAINATYTGIEIKYNQNFTFDFDISLEYAGHEGLAGFKFTEKREKPTEGYYKGYHKSSGNSRIFIKSEYGNLKLIKI